MLEKLKRLLAHPRLPIAAALLAVLLTLPALGAGFIADDYSHRVSFLPEFRAMGGIRGDWDMFRFTGPDRGYFHKLMDLGIWPWWAAPSLRLAFFRPLSALSHALDYRLLSRWPVLLHAESLALYAGIALAAALVYRRLISPAWVAGLAAILFAVDDAHSMPVTWLANRNALFAALFGFAALAAHDRARRDGHRGAAVAAPVLYALGLLGGEAAVATLGYLAAHALFLDEASPRKRLVALLPYALVTAAWMVVYVALGYGTTGSGFYVDPGREPLAFAGALVTRLPALLLAQLFGPPSDVWMGIPPARLPWLVAGASTVVALFALGLWRVLRGDRRAGFFATGMVLALLPMCATWPNDRLLLFSGLGAFGLVALFLARVGEVASGPARFATRALAVLFVFAHALLAPVLLHLRCMSFQAIYTSYFDRADRSLTHYSPEDTLVIVNAPDLLIANYVGCGRMLAGEPPGKHMRLLATAIDGNGGEMERLDARTVVLTLRDGFVGDAFGQVARGPSVPFHVGDVVNVDGMTAEVEEVTADARPKRVRFRFDRALEDASMKWVTWEGNGFVTAAVPAVGEKVEVPAIDFFGALLGRG
jgi:hypothetical protein